MIYVREAGIGIGPSVAAAALRSIGRPVLGVDLARTAAGRDPQEAVGVLGREALLRGAGVVAGPVESLSDGAAEALRPLADLPVPVAIVGTVTWDPSWTDSVPLVIDAPTLSPSQRIALWTRELTGADPGRRQIRRSMGSRISWRRAASTRAPSPPTSCSAPARWPGRCAPPRPPRWSAPAR